MRSIACDAGVKIPSLQICRPGAPSGARGKSEGVPDRGTCPPIEDYLVPHLELVISNGAVPVEVVAAGQGLLPFAGVADVIGAVSVLGLPELFAFAPQGLGQVLADGDGLVAAVFDGIYVLAKAGVGIGNAGAVQGGVAEAGLKGMSAGHGFQRGVIQFVDGDFFHIESAHVLMPSFHESACLLMSDRSVCFCFRGERLAACVSALPWIDTPLKGRWQRMKVMEVIHFVNS